MTTTSHPHSPRLTRVGVTALLAPVTALVVVAGATPAAARAAFVPGERVVTAGGSLAPQFADVDGDGDLDQVVGLFVARPGAPSERVVQLYLNDGGGGFAPGGTLPKGAGYGPALGDLNGDGAADIAYVGGGAVQVQLADGTGGFGSPTAFASTVAAATTSVFLYLEDVDGDADRDLFVGAREFSGNEPSRAEVLLGDGSGALGAPAALPACVDCRLREMVLGDLDGDGRPEVVAAANRPSAIHVFDNLGDGRFAAPEVRYSVPRPVALTLADIDDDGALDLVCGSGRGEGVGFPPSASTYLWVIGGDGNGGFTGAKKVELGQDVASFYTVVDLDGDGRPDIAHLEGGSLYVSYNYGRGFGPDLRVGPAHRSGVPQPYFIDHGDLDGDADADLLLAADGVNGQNDSFQVLFNQTAAAG